MGHVIHTIDGDRWDMEGQDIGAITLDTWEKLIKGGVTGASFFIAHEDEEEFGRFLAGTAPTN